MNQLPDHWLFWLVLIVMCAMCIAGSLGIAVVFLPLGYNFVAIFLSLLWGLACGLIASAVLDSCQS